MVQLCNSYNIDMLSLDLINNSIGESVCQATACILRNLRIASG